MPLAQDEVTAISLDVIQAQLQPLELVGIIATEGGSNRVELMVTVGGCHEEPCRLLLNLSRGSRAEFEVELRRKLDEALRGHVRPA